MRKGEKMSDEMKERLRQKNIGKVYSDEYKKKMSERLKGRVFLEEHRKNLSKAKSKENHHFFGKKLTEEHKNNLSKVLIGNNRCLGYKHSEKAKKNMSESKIGHKTSEETRRKLAIANSGDKCHFWKGGKTKEITKLRMSLEYRLWREAVFKRDDYTCIWCGEKSRKGVSVILNADHIKPFAHYPELRFAIDNGRTLCKECHKTTETFGNKARYLIK